MIKSISSIWKSQPIAIYGFALISAICLGMISSIFPPLAVVALVFLPLLIVITWIYPAIALLILIAVVYGVIPPYLVPNIPIGGGNLQANDLALGCLFPIVFLRFSKEIPSILIKIKPMAFPFILLVLLFSISLTISIIYFQTPVKNILAETRNFLYWLIMPIVVAIIANNRTKYQFILNGILVIGYIIAFALIFQHLTNIDILGSGRVSQLVTLDKTSDVIRTTSPGIYLVVLSIYFLVARWLTGKSTALTTGIACTPLILGLLVTFGRGVWIASAVCLLLLAASIGRNAFWRLCIIGTLLLTIVLCGLFILKPETVHAIADRFFSVAQEVNSGSSVEWRYLENNYAINHLMNNPIVGVGIGGFAHPKFHPIMNDDLLRFVHNGYLYLAVKLGIFSLLIPITIIWQVLKIFRMEKEQHDGNTSYSKKSLLAIFFVPCITSFTQPEWMVYTGVTFLALVLGLILAAPEVESTAQ